MYLNLLRQTVEPICQDFEGCLSRVLLPHGRRVRMTRETVLRDDMATEVTTAHKALTGGLWTWEESRERLGLPGDEHLKPATVGGYSAGPPPAADPNDGETML